MRRVFVDLVAAPDHLSLSVERLLESDEHAAIKLVRAHEGKTYSSVTQAASSSWSASESPTQSRLIAISAPTGASRFTIEASRLTPVCNGRVRRFARDLAAETLIRWADRAGSHDAG